jgi:hypothetical protein
MSLASKGYIAFDRLVRTSLREKYWDAVGIAEALWRLYADGNADFRRHAQRDFALYFFDRIRPIEGENERRAHAAVDWILRAQRATPDDGVSLGYFPCSAGDARWRCSYPETTGYIITSLLAFARRYANVRVRDAALRMARWETSIQMASGAVQGGPLVLPEERTPAAFNTGMVLDGWCSAWEATRDPEFLDAGRRAADFLVADLDDKGYFRTNGAFVKAGEVKTYTCLCAWAMYRFGDIVDEEQYRDAAIRIVVAALRNQQANGWFSHNCLTRSDAPLTHTLGYTMQGILEVGTLAKRADFVAAVERTMQALLPNISNNGFLPGMFFSNWRPATVSSCLTGSAQIAVVSYRLCQVTGRSEYGGAGDRLTNFLKALQSLHAADENVHGALAGSFPLFGDYMRGGYPNWATKYLLDALLAQEWAVPGPGCESTTV